MPDETRNDATDPSDLTQRHAIEPTGPAAEPPAAGPGAWTLPVAAPIAPIVEPITPWTAGSAAP